MEWNLSADVVVIGAGAAGLPAAIAARDHGASVILVEENFDIGGHAMLSGGRVQLGGGNALQRKFNIEDIKERKYWKQYMKAYEQCLSATSTREAPWHVVPADDKATTRLIVSRVIVDALKDLKMKYPQVDPRRRKELAEIRRLLSKS